MEETLVLPPSIALFKELSWATKSSTWVRIGFATVVIAVEAVAGSAEEGIVARDSAGVTATI